MKNVYEKTKKQRGVALLIVLAVSAIIIPLIQGVWMDTQVEYQFNRYRMNELQARYNAKSGIALNLLRIYIFKGVERSISEKLKPHVRSLLDRVWVFPLVWPFFPSEEMLGSQKQDVNSLVGESFLKGAYATSIAPVDGLLNVNELSSPLVYLREFTYSTLLNFLLNAVQKKKELRDKYDEQDLEEILNNLSDWTDLDNDSQNGGSEELLGREGEKPLNRSFASIEEIKKVPKMEQDIFEILSPHITVYGTKALNINYSSKEIFQALGFPEELAEQVLLRITMSSDYYDPFLDQKAFCDFVDKQGFSFCDGLKENWETLDMLSFGFPMAFRIRSSGEYRGQIVDLEALIYDLSSVSLLYQKFQYFETEREKKKEGISNQKQNLGKQQGEESAQKPEQPKIDYSYYKSLIIMYLKEKI